MVKQTWLHDRDQVALRVPEFWAILREQIRVAITRAPGCAVCGLEPGWPRLYRCLQCDLWLCMACALEHMPDVVRT